jgi:hypothetical protein
MKPQSRRLVAAGLAALVLVSAVVAGGGVTLAQEEAANAPSADELYVEDDGDAVLVHRSEGTDANATVDFGADLDSGLVHTLLVAPMADTGNLSATLTAAAAGDALAARGNLAAPRPADLESLDLDVDAVTNETESSTDATLDGSVRNASVGFESAHTEGRTTTTADRLRTEAQFRLEPSGMAGPGSVLDVALTEDDGTFRIDVTRQLTVGEEQASAWQSRQAVRQRVGLMVGLLARQLGGEADVSVDSLDVTPADGGGSEVAVEYTITLRDVEEGLERMVSDRLAATENVSRDRAEAVARNLTNATIEEAAFRVDSTNDATTGNVTLDVEGYGDLFESWLTIAQTQGANPAAMQSLQRSRTALEAQRAANLTQTTTWNATMDTPEPGIVDVTAELHQSATNWSEYVAELEERDVQVPRSAFALSAETSGDRIVANGTLEASGEGLLAPMGTGTFDQATVSGADATVSGTAADVLAALGGADVERARFMATLEADLRVEAAARVTNPESVGDALANDTGLPPMTSVVGRTENGTTTTYVRVPDAVEGDPTEADLRALPWVDEDTTVHLPGTWDREFPTVDTERASEFLEGGPAVQVNATAGDGLDESDGDGLNETDGNETDGAAGEAAVGTVLPV